MDTEMNLIYDPKEKTYILLTEKHWKNTLYQSHLNIGESIDENKIVEEMKRIRVRETNLSSTPIRGYETLTIDELVKTTEKIYQKDDSLKIILPENTTP